jgi:8-oxo-dGTP pyrophosphatase MutT (NUDIX family)
VWDFIQSYSASFHRAIKENRLATKRNPPACVTQSRIVYRGPRFSVRRDRLREPHGIAVTREIVVHPGSVVLLPVLDDGRIILVRQYRHAAGRYLWELVAGGIEPGEEPQAAARRELAEETGYSGRRLRPLTEFFPTPGFVTERMMLYLVEGLQAGEARPEADEHLRVGAFHLSDLERKIRRGAIRDGKTIAGVLFYSRFAQKRS